MKYVLAASSVAALVACGGGGSEPGGAVASNLSFDLSTALRQVTTAGQSANFSIVASNGCVGTGSLTSGPANTSTTFEAQSALSSTSRLEINYTNCTPALISNLVTNYYDLNYTPLGALGDNGKYIVYNSVSAPSSVRVGDIGIIGDGNRYSDISKASSEGTIQLSYVVEADTASTAIISVASKAYSSSSALEITQLVKYRINASSSLTLVSQTIQYANGVSVVLTKN
jgi:hypothetical protein